MNQIEAEKIRRLYLTPQTNHQTRPVNAVFISPGNSTEHELYKCVAGLMVAKYNEIYLPTEKLQKKNMPTITDKIKALAKAIEEVMETFPKEQGRFITEAVPIENKKRKVDLVMLNPHNRLEFVKTSLPEGAKNDGSIIINIP